MRTLLIIIAMTISACTNPDNATRILRENGYTDVRMTGYSWYACSEDDIYHSGFQAKSPLGSQVAGTVCEGLFFKNSTIRFE
jgi:hypothetical protein